MSGFNTKEKNNYGEYEIAFYTDNHEDFKKVQDLCRELIDHDKPVSTEGDLISRSALKKAIFEYCRNEKEILYHYLYYKNIITLIDNAPTVAVDCKDCDGYEAGYSAGLKDAERQEGEYETACNVLLSLEQIVRSSDGWEESAVEVVHNAVQTAIKCMHKRTQGECGTCRHRDPEDKKCDCGGQERQGCPFPVSDDYFCKFYEKEGAV